MGSASPRVEFITMWSARAAASSMRPNTFRRIRVITTLLFGPIRSASSLRLSVIMTATSEAGVQSTRRPRYAMRRIVGVASSAGSWPLRSRAQPTELDIWHHIQHLVAKREQVRGQFDRPSL